VNDRAYLSIGEVLGLLQDEFPDVTISKIRFLESQGLIDPERTPSGYRKFYDADIDRLRFILREQREHFLPLRVIKDRLETNGEAGTVAVQTAVEAEEVALPPAAPASAGPATAAPAAAAKAEPAGPPPEPGSLTADQLCAVTGLSRRELGEVERYGLLSGTSSGATTYYDPDAVDCARLAAVFLRHGVEPRHLRLYRNGVDREAALFEQVVLPLVKQRNPQARAHAVEALRDLVAQGGQLREALLRQSLRAYLEGS